MKENRLKEEITKEEKDKIIAESISRRITCVALTGVIREMFTWHMEHAKHKDKQVRNLMKNKANKFFERFDAAGHNENTYMESSIERLTEHAVEISKGDTYEEKRAVFTVYLSVLEFITSSWFNEVVFSDKKILSSLHTLCKVPTRHFNGVNTIDIKEALEDVYRHVDTIRQTTEEILLNQDKDEMS